MSKRMLLRLTLTGVLSASCVISLHAQPISAAQAKDHVGQQATVCDTVASTHYSRSTRGQPTFINLDKPYPDQVFTILIWGSDRGKFGAPETVYRDKHVCVTGTITSYRGVPEIVARDPSQVQIR